MVRLEGIVVQREHKNVILNYLDDTVIVRGSYLNPFQHATKRYGRARGV